MDYQTLTDVIGQSKMGAAPAPSLNSIIQGIQSQYQPAPSMLGQSGMYGANRYISGTPQFGAIEQIPEFGRLSQLAGPSFVPSAFDKSLYEKVDTQRLSDLISQIDSGGDNGGFGSNGMSVDDVGLATSSNIGTMGVTGLAMALGAVTGLPAGLMANIAGKQNIANAINAQSHAQAAAFNQALVAQQMGLTNSPANAAALASAIDSLSAANASTAAATIRASGTGGSAAAAGAAAASAAAAAGVSAAGQGAAAQAAADATIGGASAAEAADAGANAGIGADAAAAGDAAGAAASADGNDGSTGVAWAEGGKVTKDRLIGPKPNGPDDGFGALQHGEFVIKKTSVDKYGDAILSLLNEGKISKKKLKSLI